MSNPRSDVRAPDPWYAKGLRFECLPDCGACCTNHDEHTYVYLEGDDLERLTRHLELAPDEFTRRYTELDEGERVLKMDDPACPFLEGSRCTVYEARPTQCRTFPFWPENLASRTRFRSLRRFCPGIGRGETHPLHVIQRHLDERRD